MKYTQVHIGQFSVRQPCRMREFSSAYFLHWKFCAGTWPKRMHRPKAYQINHNRGMHFSFAATSSESFQIHISLFVTVSIYCLTSAAADYDFAFHRYFRIFWHGEYEYIKWVGEWTANVRARNIWVPFQIRTWIWLSLESCILHPPECTASTGYLFPFVELRKRK